MKALACSVGKHQWKNGASMGYGGSEEGSRHCENCGQYEKTWGHKTYKTPYWESGSTVVRPGRYSKDKAGDIKRN